MFIKDPILFMPIHFIQIVSSHRWKQIIVKVYHLIVIMIIPVSGGLIMIIPVSGGHIMIILVSGGLITIIPVSGDLSDHASTQGLI